MNQQLYNLLDAVIVNSGGIKGENWKTLVQFFRDRSALLHHNKFDFRYLSTLNLSADLLFDIGVDSGTPPLYSTYSSSKFILVDPLQENLDKTKLNYPDMDFDCYCCALSHFKGEAQVNIPFSAQGHSSLKERCDQRDLKETRSVAIETLDNLSQPYLASNPLYAVKIDVEGAELDVIKGGIKTISNAQFLIIESNIKKHYVDSYSFSDLISQLASLGFELYDVLNGFPKSPSFMDVLFLPRKHPYFTQV